jgi:uncharacterized protein (TIRG00374 family)
MNKNLLQTIIGIILGGAFLFFTLYNKSISDIIDSLKQVDFMWLLFTGLILIIVFVLRALRWKLLLNNAGESPKTYSVFYALVLGYFVNSFTPKFGEVVRCTSLTKSENIQASTSLGTVISERIYDLIILIIGIFTVLFVEFDRLKSLFLKAYHNIFSKVEHNWLIITLAIVGIVLLLILLFWLSRRNKAAKKTANFLKQTHQTVIKTFKIKKYGLFITYTILIWVVLVGLNYAFLMCLPETNMHGFYFATVIIFVGGIGWAIPSPGGIGTTHFFILQLFLAFDLTEKAGLAYGVLSNGLTFVYIILFGLIAIAVNLIKVSRNARNEKI